MARSKEEKMRFIQSLRDGVEQLKAGNVIPPDSLLESYSLGNALTILFQRPSATRCAGFHAWREAGRSVRKGAKGIAILVPLRGSNDDDPIRWSWRYVFDIADTEEITSNSPALLRELEAV